MKKYLLRHLQEYIILALLIASLAVLILSVHEPFWRGLLSSALIFSYIFWGFWHHYREKTLSDDVILEYFMVALLILSVLIAKFS